MKVDLARLEAIGNREIQEQPSKQNGKWIVLLTAAGAACLLLFFFRTGSGPPGVSREMIEMSFLPGSLLSDDLEEGVEHDNTDAADGETDAGDPEDPATAGTEGSGTAKTAEGEKEAYTIAVTSVDTLLNVRTEPSETAEQIGVLYKDCGGTVLDQQDGWTKIESGRLVGWVKDEFLLFDEDAETLVNEAGNRIATVDASSLRIRKEPDHTSDVTGLAKEKETVKITGILDGGWAEVEYHDRTGYVTLDQVSLRSLPKNGETMEEMAERKRREKKKGFHKTFNAGYEGTVNDLDMLAAIVYCEAGNQPYEGKVAVANVVLNRLKSARFPNDVNAVIRSPRQFSPVSSGRFDRALASGVPESCYQAAKDAMAGISYVGECLFFKNPMIAGAHPGITIGSHVFW